MADSILPVKHFAAVLFNNETSLENGLKLLSESFGHIDSISEKQRFDVTDYYSKEMGKELFRVIISFHKLVMPSALPELKLGAIQIESTVKSESGLRSLNIDSGYIDFDKVVLASTKKGPFKIYMDKGIWADLVLHYEKGTFHSFIWSFADFKDGRYNKSLLHVRELYKRAKPA